MVEVSVNSNSRVFVDNKFNSNKLRFLNLLITFKIQFKVFNNFTPLHLHSILPLLHGEFNVKYCKNANQQKKQLKGK